MAESESNAPASQETKESLRAEQTAGGRYIPYSGGSAGWFENSGVLKSEARNNYRYHLEMESPEVRRKLFERWGPSEERREGSPRERRQLPMNLLREGESQSMRTWDINSRGIRLQFAEPPRLQVGDEVSVELLGGADGGPLVLLDANVIWVEESGTTRKVWQVGMFFPFVSAESGVVLNQLLKR